MSAEPDTHTITVVISTYERPDACERALESVLAQTLPPQEILVCDHGSTDDTPERLSRWEQHSALVRYLRIPQNRGTPAYPRNLGISEARGRWVAFLDDDDTWLPHKLAEQRAIADGDDADVIATNALRSTGGRYFPALSGAWRPTRRDILARNPIITSSALVRREALENTPGFVTARWAAGAEDYEMWLQLADRGARFVILGEPLVLYQEAPGDRLSLARTKGQRAIARLAWRRAIARPIDLLALRAALRASVGLLHIAGADGAAALRRRTVARLARFRRT